MSCNFLEFYNNGNLFEVNKFGDSGVLVKVTAYIDEVESNELSFYDFLECLRKYTCENIFISDNSYFGTRFGNEWSLFRYKIESVCKYDEIGNAVSSVNKILSKKSQAYAYSLWESKYKFMCNFEFIEESNLS